MNRTHLAPLALVVALAVTACAGDPEDFARDALARHDIGLPGVDIAGGDVAVDAPDVGPEDGQIDIGMPTSTPNRGWIGGACASTAECTYDDAVCLSSADGYPGGQCTQPCDRICPDRAGDNSVTLCVDAPGGTPLAGGGQCISRCDFGLYPGSGCRDDYVCRTVGRNGEPETQVAACVRPEDGGGQLGDCLAMLDMLGVAWSPWAHADESPEGRPDLTCSVDDPIRVDSPINGVDWRYYSHDSPRPMNMSCELAIAMHRLGDVLQEHEITDVLHIGTYVCKKIGDGPKISQHGLGLAVDIWGFEDASGRSIVLEDHWEHDDTTPSTYEGQVLWDVARRMHDDRIFNVVLTPNYNAAHDNHFHIDLTAGSHFIGARKHVPTWYIGPHTGDTGCHDH